MNTRNPSSLFDSGYNFRKAAVTLLALIVTGIIHWLAYTIIPWEIEKTSFKQTKALSITYQQATEKAKQRFIETNPDLPSNEPDTADAFAARNQQASQTKEASSSFKENPFIDGSTDNSHKVTSGDLNTQQPPASASTPNTQNLSQPANQSQPVTSSATIESEPFKDEPLQEEGITSIFYPNQNKKQKSQQTTIEKIIPIDPLSPTVDNPVPNKIPSLSPPSQQPASVQPTQPRPRPRVAPDVLYGEILKSKGNAIPAQGNALNAKFNAFGDYLQQMYEIIGLQWYALNRNTNTIRDEIASSVIIEFSIDQQGQVTRLEVKQSTAGTIATLICQDAIRSRAPFGQWTKEMIATLDEEEIIIFQFNYY